MFLKQGTYINPKDRSRRNIRDMFPSDNEDAVSRAISEPNLHGHDVDYSEISTDSATTRSSTVPAWAPWFSAATM